MIPGTGMRCFAERYLVCSIANWETCEGEKDEFERMDGFKYFLGDNSMFMVLLSLPRRETCDQGDNSILVFGVDIHHRARRRQ